MVHLLLYYFFVVFVVVVDISILILFLATMMLPPVPSYSNFTKSEAIFLNFPTTPHSVMTEVVAVHDSQIISIFSCIQITELDNNKSMSREQKKKKTNFGRCGESR